MDKIKLTCINCPLGCLLEVQQNNKEVIVTGNSCLRGKKYALSEISNPTRVITTTIKIGNSNKMLSVKSNQGIPKDKIFDCINVLKGVEVSAPVEINDVIIKNVLDTGVDIIATKSIKGEVING